MAHILKVPPVLLTFSNIVPKWLLLAGFTQASTVKLLLEEKDRSAE